MKTLPTFLKQYSVFLGLIILFMLIACKKETNQPQTPPALATTILGKWKYTGIEYIKQSISQRNINRPPIPVYNFLNYGFCAISSNLADVVSYNTKNDSLINFAGYTDIPVHEYKVKIIGNKMVWTGLPPFTDSNDPRLTDPDLKYIEIFFDRVP